MSGESFAKFNGCAVMIYLASKSPRRSELLRQIKVEHICLAVNIDETPVSDERPREYVERMALEKATQGWKCSQRSRKLPLLAADTSVVLDLEILGKPKTKEDAICMLDKLSNRTHQVITSVVVKQDSIAKLATSVTDVTFGDLSKTIIDYYVSSDDCFDKAGGYGIQGFAAQFVASIKGSYSGVVGLPLYETSRLLNQFK